MGLFGFGKKEKDKMKDGLEKTRTGFWGNIMNTLTGSKIDDDLYDELEEHIIISPLYKKADSSMPSALLSYSTEMM